MKIEEAIVSLDYLRFLNKRKEDTGTFEALKLGIEALKRIKADRQCTFAMPLPGETVDEDPK